MSEEQPKKPNLHEEEKPQKGMEREGVKDPRDLVMKGGYNKNPRELVNNPAVTPEMLNEPGDIRHDLIETE